MQTKAGRGEQPSLGHYVLGHQSGPREAEQKALAFQRAGAPARLHAKPTALQKGIPHKRDSHHRVNTDAVAAHGLLPGVQNSMPHRPHTHTYIRRVRKASASVSYRGCQGARGAPLAWQRGSFPQTTRLISSNWRGKWLTRRSASQEQVGKYP